MRGFFVLMLLIPLVACGQDLAEVNGTKLTVEDYDSFVKMHKAHPYKDAAANERQMVIESMIKRELLAQAAEKKDFEKKPEFAQAMEENKAHFPGQDTLLKKMLLINFLFQDMASAPEFSDAELKKEFDAESQKRAHDYRIQQILLEKESDAKNVLKQLKAGKKFADEAKTTSKDISARNGGDMGWICGSALPDSFAQALTHGKGLYPEPVKSDFGWHVVDITDVRDVPNTENFDEAKDRIKQAKVGSRIEAYVAELEKSAKIVRH